jgi:hypothetical protein
MVATALAPEISRGPAAEALPVQATATCRIVTPVQPEEALHTILLLVWRLIVLDADGSPAIVREHGKKVEHNSTVIPEGQSASPVRCKMSPSYTRVSQTVERPDAGHAKTCFVPHTKRSKVKSPSPAVLRIKSNYHHHQCRM